MTRVMLQRTGLASAVESEYNFMKKSLEYNYTAV